MSKKPQVIDFFCGAGGFSEGFRQQGFEVVMGIDNWRIAIDSHNLNHGLNDKARDVLEFESSTEAINALPNTEVIVGSPPCVSFSLSNKGGKACKELGISLIESFLRVIAVKKHQPGSKLVAWFMENVPNSKNYIQPTYTFRELGLADWAKDHRIAPDTVALNATKEGEILDTAALGTAQKRKRFVCGEIIKTGQFPDLSAFKVEKQRTVRMVRGRMPAPKSAKSKALIADPNYPTLKIPTESLTDHFYDSGVYECQWKEARWLKENHYCMGRMAFPENEDKPSRTVMATQSASTREALLYKSEYDRKGDGEYRLPTVREVATIMGFPYTYQFIGGESNKWRQVGNAVAPHLSSALAKSVRLTMGLQIIADAKVAFDPASPEKLHMVDNLNTYAEKVFDSPPKKKKKAVFRRHPFKVGNMTVALTNYLPEKDHKPTVGNPVKWYSTSFFGAGKEFQIRNVERNGYKRISKIIEEQHNSQGSAFLEKFENRFHRTIGSSDRFQSTYIGEDKAASFNPRAIIEEIEKFIIENEPGEKVMVVPEWISPKEKIPTKQVLTLYAINRIIS
jgi:DNA (cytosine-5)-methyltransferase 1